MSFFAPNVSPRLGYTRGESVINSFLTLSCRFATYMVNLYTCAPSRYSFAPEMDPAARKWLKEYKKLFDEVARFNAGANAAENIGADNRVLKVIGKVVDDSTGTTTKVSDTVIKKIGKIVENDEKTQKIEKNSQKTPLTRTNDENVQVSGRSAIHYPNFSKSDIEANIKHIATMDSVKDIPADKLKKTGKKPKEMFAEYFKSLENHLYSPLFGDISLSNSSVKSEGRHGFTAEKVASMEAIPNVIENGRVIFHKTKGDVTGTVDRIVVAAPIKIADEDYYMGVMLQRDYHSQRLYLHNVASIKAEEVRTTSQADSLTNWVYEEDSTLFITSILQNAINVKLNDEKTLAKTPEALDSLTKSQAISLIQRGVKGDDLLNVADLAEEIKSVGGEITKDGNAVLYHGTSKVNADKINSTGKMYGKEDGLFFSTKKDGLVLDYGEAVVKVEIPLEKLVLDDVFSDEVHLRMPTRQFKYTDVKISSDNGNRSALADGTKATMSEVAAAKRSIAEMNIDPRGIMAIADSYFDRYSGQLTRTGLRYEFLNATQLMLSDEINAFERAFARIEAIADELIYNEKDRSGLAEQIDDIKRHVREITFTVDVNGYFEQISWLL